jgi:hypothetical protein
MELVKLVKLKPARGTNERSLVACADGPKTMTTTPDLPQEPKVVNACENGPAKFFKISRLPSMEHFDWNMDLSGFTLLFSGVRTESLGTGQSTTK